MKRSWIMPRMLSRDRVIANIVDAIKALPISEGFRAELHEHKSTRSLAQNAYLWGCVYPTILDRSGGKLAGWEATDIHEFFLGEHFGWEVLAGFGKRRQRPIRRSRKLSKIEFMEFVAFIQRRAAELGIIVPDPNERQMEAA